MEQGLIVWVGTAKGGRSSGAPSRVICQPLFIGILCRVPHGVHHVVAISGNNLIPTGEVEDLLGRVNVAGNIAPGTIHALKLFGD